MLDKLLVENLEVVMPDFAPFADAPRQARQVVEQAVAPALLKLLGQGLTPRQVAGGMNVRLIAEDAGHTLAELLPDLAPVGFHGQLQELLRDAGREQIHVTPVAMPGRVLRAHLCGHEVARLRQRLAGLDLRCEVLAGVALETIDSDQVIRPFWGGLGLAES